MRQQFDARLKKSSNCLRSAPDIKLKEAKIRQQSEVDEIVKGDFQSNGLTAQDLRRLGTSLLLCSNDPRRQPIAFRLFAIAYGGHLIGLDASQAPDSVKFAADSQSKGDSAWCDDDAGYSWAGMVLSNAAPPPPDGNGSMDKSTKEQVISRIIGLWKEAGSSGVGDAWFELGNLYLSEKHVPKDEDLAYEHFQEGAKLSHPPSHCALGVLHSLRANITNQSEKREHLEKSFHHFLQAAQKGDVQSMYNVGVSYLLQAPPEPRFPPSYVKQSSVSLRERHLEGWGVEPDDILARSWFEKAAARNFAPAIMNLAGMLVEGRGNPEAVFVEGTDGATPQKDGPYAGINLPGRPLTRIESLRLSMALYAKIVAMGSASSSIPGGSRGGLAAFGVDREGAEEMVKVARREMDRIEKMVENEEKLARAGP
ncbi:hypothetical protein IE53DRAFT_364539 [Violaceomyces palustris]|uniref:Uncharacterized protein n=1 Tax=Violaceomyces palustris TaxID=1673888 RepID=A0ACD0NP88_9BASI|nr:hypothetical protein IE53DRAFT_364539 [Violaceomyces palustris]